MIEFSPEIPPKPGPIFNNQELPKDELEIYYKDESEFLPPGKKMEDLTPEEKIELQNKYRFSPLRPATYQGITGIKRR